MRQAKDFPFGRGFTSGVHVAASNSPPGDVLQSSVRPSFSKEEMQRFEGETAKNFVAEGIQSLCCVPLLRPKGGLWECSCWAARGSKPSWLGRRAVCWSRWPRNWRSQLKIIVPPQRSRLSRQRLGEEKKYLSEEIRSQGEFAEIVGESDRLSSRYSIRWRPWLPAMRPY